MNIYRLQELEHDIFWRAIIQVTASLFNNQLIKFLTI